MYLQTPRLILCRSKYKDKDIGLIDVADFKREAPEHFLSGIEDDYELQLQRLAHEKYQRQELVSRKR